MRQITVRMNERVHELAMSQTPSACGIFGVSFSEYIFFFGGGEGVFSFH